VGCKPHSTTTPWPLLLLLFLQLYVLAVILSAAKNPHFVFAVACSFSKTKKIVISTEAAHSLIVSSAAEKSASLPFRSPTNNPQQSVPNR
jgi:hypothetical protein